MYQEPEYRLVGGMYASEVPDFDLNTAVATELDAMRRYAGLTQAELSKRAGISIRSVQRYLDGERPIRIDDLAKMAAALGADPLEVFQRAQRRVQK